MSAMFFIKAGLITVVVMTLLWALFYNDKP